MSTHKICFFGKMRKILGGYPTYLELFTSVQVEDIYSFTVNTINIFIKCNENSIFHECEARVKIRMFSLHEMKIFLVFTEEE